MHTFFWGFSKTKSSAFTDEWNPRNTKNVADVCVVGAGLSGAVIAERYATQRNKSVLVLEKRSHIGGNCYDYIDEETGIRVNQYGAHLFHTQYKPVWDYVQQFAEWIPYEHRVVAFVEGKHVPVPVNIDTVNALFGLSIRSEAEMDEWLRKEQAAFPDPKNSEETALSRVGRRLYELLFKPYTIKQWDKTPSELGPEVMARIPVRNNHDPNYFGDPYQALPQNGYTAIFERMFDHQLITVQTGVDYFDVRETLRCGRTYFTGPIDAYFAHLGWPKLQYRSLDFERKVVRDVGYFQPNSVVNHPSPDVNYTRIVEYKHMLNQTSPHTVVFYERSKNGGEPYYPVPNPENKALYAKYQAMAAKEPNVTFVGRLANYKYLDMDQTVKNALELFDRDTLTPRNSFAVGSFAEERCFTLAVHKLGTFKSQNKIRAVLDVARRAASLLSGDFVEAGVAAGGSSLAVLFYLACSGHLGARDFHLFDTWEGLPSPTSEHDNGFKKGQWNVTMKRFHANVDKWGAYYRNHPSPFFSWNQATARLKTYVGLFADTMPVVLATRSIAALYCDGDTYQSSLDCLNAAGPRLEDHAWVYHDDYLKFKGNFLAVNFWVSQGTHSHADMQLVPQRGDWKTIKDLNKCTPPKDNSGGTGGLCGGIPTEACFWQIRRRLPLKNTNHSQSIYDVYKAHIDAKIDALPRYGKPCTKHRVYTGEFGYELQGIVPWYYDEHRTKQCDLTVTAVQGTRYLYWFASSLKLIETTRSYRRLPRDAPLANESPHVEFLPRTRWTMPPWREFFGQTLDTDALFPSSKKAIMMVFNKHTDREELDGDPVDFIDVDTLRRLLTLLTPSYQILYVRMEDSILQDTHEKKKTLKYRDKEMIRNEHPSVVLFEDVFNERTMDYILLLFGLAAKASLFVSVQGGNSVVASLWGAPNFIYAVKGDELGANAYKKIYGQFGGSGVRATDDRNRLVQLIQQYLKDK
eukprot:GHVN01075417.1.p1 GENE.GHVN01075417.1~~GHVN01075417.1.p1  ORF type:complete len:991 (+),score=44.30 GHVN01075417.1:63-2975(+)